MLDTNELGKEPMVMKEGACPGSVGTCGAGEGAVDVTTEECECGGVPKNSYDSADCADMGMRNCCATEVSTKGGVPDLMGHLCC